MTDYVRNHGRAYSAPTPERGKWNRNYMRPPTPIVLRQGWNHVKLTVPCQKAARYASWVATFIPMLGTTEHPREVPGLEYASEPHSR